METICAHNLKEGKNYQMKKKKKKNRWGPRTWEGAGPAPGRTQQPVAPGGRLLDWFCVACLRMSCAFYCFQRMGCDLQQNVCNNVDL
jgi:hypothetical protein